MMLDRTTAASLHHSHASVVTTERYIHHTLADLAKAAAVLEDGGVFDPTREPTVGGSISAV